MQAMTRRGALGHRRNDEDPGRMLVLLCLQGRAITQANTFGILASSARYSLLSMAGVPFPESA